MALAEKRGGGGGETGTRASERKTFFREGLREDLQKRSRGPLVMKIKSQSQPLRGFLEVLSETLSGDWFFLLEAPCPLSPQRTLRRGIFSRIGCLVSLVTSVDSLE